MAGFEKCFTCEMSVGGKEPKLVALLGFTCWRHVIHLDHVDYIMYECTFFDRCWRAVPQEWLGAAMHSNSGSGQAHLEGTPEACHPAMLPDAGPPDAQVASSVVTSCGVQLLGHSMIFLVIT